MFGKFLKESKELKKILEKTKILKVFWQEDPEDPQRTPLALDNEKTLKKFLEKNQLKKEFLENLFEEITNINNNINKISGQEIPVIFFKKKVSFKKKRVLPEELTGLGMEENKSEFRINLEDPRFDTLEESKIETIAAIYLSSRFYWLNIKNLENQRRILEEKRTFEKVERYLEEKLEKKRETEFFKKVIDELKNATVLNSTEIQNWIDAIPFPKYSLAIKKLLVKSARATRYSLQEAGAVEILFYLVDLAMFFEEARILHEQRLGEKIEQTVNRFLSEELKEIFREFKRIYFEVAERKYWEEIELIKKEIFIPEMLDEYKTGILKEVSEKRGDNQIKREIERISEREEEIERVLRELVRQGVRKKDFEEVLKKGV